MTPDMIDDFRGPYRWLSNYHEAVVTFEDDDYPSTEHAFQAAKSLDPTWRRLVREAPRPRDAKRLGRTIPLRPDWEAVKDDVMYRVNRDKYTRHADLRARLLDTGRAQLIEGNTWGDRVWGVCDGVGENRLGRILMLIRTELQDQ
jgi:hypothetical protein